MRFWRELEADEQRGRITLESCLNNFSYWMNMVTDLYAIFQEPAVQGAPSGSMATSVVGEYAPEQQ